MTSIVTQYFNLNRILLLAIGLWPYQRSKFTQLRLILCLGMLTSSILFQVTRFMTVECTIELCIKILSCTLFFIMFIIKFISFWINTQTIRYLSEQLQHIHNELKDENEIAIIEKYGCNAKRYTTRIILLTICSTCTIIFLPMWPRILDFVLYTNESRPRRTLQIVTEYFFDQERYFYVILLHMNAAICIGATAMIAAGTMLISYLKHACGMFKIARFAELLISSFEGTFFFLIAVSVCCLSLNLFRIFQIVSLGEDGEEFLIHFIIGSVIILYIFLANYAGQEITDHNNHVFSTAYNVQWYVAPLQIQKLILFLLQRGSKTFTLNVGGFFVASLKCFASLTSSSISYFTVMYSTQQ